MEVAVVAQLAKRRVGNRRRGAMRMSARIVAMVILAAAMHSTAARASHPSLTECFEGSDFIGNAALARDAGMSERQFIDRMQQDFTIIHAFPQELRWFAHDVDDESFLLNAARDVFDLPALPEEHRRAFLQVCLLRMGEGPLAPPSTSKPDGSDSTT
jgi:hypothetical protein